jgi:pimeloyl-ACP methyl ester carboxylesterase
MSLIHILVFSFLAYFVKAQLDVCYGEYGCFTARSPFGGTIERPIGSIPKSPSIIGTKFYLYTRLNRNVESRITKDNANLYFNPDKETKFIVHGFIENGFKDWVMNMKNALLNVHEYNVIVVDWQKGCTFPDYLQATSNTQIVGAEIALLIKSLMVRYSIGAEKFHIIGHSLGSHVAGYAGKRVPNLGRITGLDPAGPFFENTNKIVRLDKSDAIFVDVIHTDGTATLQLGLGLMQPLGHVDFYPNGGKNQPKCPETSGKLLAGIFNIVTNNLAGIENTTACSHTASVSYFIDSIENKDCGYVAYPCASYDAFNKAKCLSCGNTGCNRVGLWANKNKDNGELFLNTQDADRFPFCQFHYKFVLNSNNLFGQTMVCLV